MMNINELITWANESHVENDRRLELMEYKKSNPLILSYCYFVGDGLPRNIHKSIELRIEHAYKIDKSKDEYDSETYLELGVCYFCLGLSGKARECFQKALNNNGKYDFCKRFITDEIIEEIKKCMERLANKNRNLQADSSLIDLIEMAFSGNSLAQLKLGIFYFNLSLDTGIRDRRKAAAWFRKIAVKGDPEAQCYLGICYLNYKGTCNKIEAQEAYKWLSKSAKSGNRDGLYYFGSLLESKKNMILQSGVDEYTYHKNVATCFLLAAEAGNIMAIRHLRNSVSFNILLNRSGEANLLKRLRKYRDSGYIEEKLLENGDAATQYQRITADYEYEHDLADAKKWIKVLRNNPRKKPYQTILLDEIEGLIAYDEHKYVLALQIFTKILARYPNCDTNANVKARTYSYLGNLYYYKRNGLTQDIEKAKRYYSKAFSMIAYRDSEKELGKEACEAWEKLRPQSSGGCFITSAVCNSFGKPDDCYELKTFRYFRDSWLMFQIDGPQLINEYYQLAPKIVNSIDTYKTSQTIYRNIWKNYLKHCLCLIEQKEYQKCKEMYVRMVLDLKHRFLHSRREKNG